MNDYVNQVDLGLMKFDMEKKLEEHLSQIEQLKFYLLPKAAIDQHYERKIQSNTNEMGDLEQNLRNYVDSSLSQLRKTITQQVESDFLKQSSFRSELVNYPTLKEMHQAVGDIKVSQ